MSFFASFFGGREDRDLLITDVTRMQGDRVCVAGVRGKEAIRLAEPAPTDSLLASIGGLTLGDLVRVDARPVRRYRPPHTEDHRWLPGSVEKVDSLDGSRIHDRLATAAFPSIVTAFGKVKYFSTRGNPVFPPDRGSRSLSTVAGREVRVYKLGDGLRADFKDAGGHWKMLPVEGLAIRAHFAHCTACSQTGQVAIPEALLRVGLGRPFKPDEQELGCFAQVNSVVTPSSGINLHQGALS